MIVLRRVSFTPQKRQSWFEWSLTVAIFSARNSSTAAPTEKRGGFVYSGNRSYLQVARQLEEQPGDAALLRDNAALFTNERVVPVDLAGKSPSSGRYF